MKNLLVLILLFSTGLAFAGKTGDDSWQIGNPTSSVDKKLIFDTGDGASNKYILLDHSLKELSTNVDKLTLGTGAAANQSVIFNRGGSNPTIRWNESNSVLEFSNDGSSFTNIGSGSGGSAGLNLIATNPDFEQSLALGWTATGLSFTAVTSGSNLLFGKQSALVDSSATSQSVASDLYTIPKGLYGRACQASIFYLGGDNTYVLKVLDGSSAVVASAAFPAAATGPLQFSLPFQCPSSGTLSLVIASTANGAAMAIDRAYLGEMAGVSQISDAKFIGSAYIDNASCNFTTTRSTLGSFDTNASCLAPQIDQNPGPGIIDTTTVTNLPKFTFKSLPPGDYVVTAHVTAGQGGGNTGLGISDGTTTSGMVGFDNTNHIAMNFTGHFSYSNTGDRTFEIVVINESAQEAIIYSDTAGVVAGWRLEIEVTKLPSSSQTAFNPATVAWYVDADVSSGASGTGTPGTGYLQVSGATITPRAGSLSTLMPCSGTNVPQAGGCTSGNPEPGISYFQPAPGAVKVCVQSQISFNVGSTQSISYTPAIDWTANADDSVVIKAGTGYSGSNTVTGTYSIDDVFPWTFCQNFNVVSAGQVTFRLNNGFTGSSSAWGIGVQNWTATPLTQQMPMPVLIHSVVSSSSGVEGFERFSVTSTCSSDPCTLATHTPGVTSINRTGTGVYSVNFTASTFSAIPTCVVMPINNGALASLADPSGSTASNFVFDIFNTISGGGPETDGAFYGICMGPK